MPIFSQTLTQMVQRIATNLGDNYAGTANGGSAATITIGGDVGARPAGYFLGSEVSVVGGTGAVQSRVVTAHTTATGIATLTVPAWTTAPDGTSLYELHRIQGKGFQRQQYINAINDAIMTAAEWMFTDKSVVALAAERGFGLAGAGTAYTVGVLRDEYPLPTGFSYLWGVDVQKPYPLITYGTGNLKAFQNLGDTANNSRVGNGFQVWNRAVTGYFSIFLNTVGNPADTLTLTVETDSGGLPSGTVVAQGVSQGVVGTSIQQRPRYVVFTVDPPALLNAATPYHWYVRRSGANDPVNYYQVGIDPTASFAFGGLETYNGVSWTRAPGQQACIQAINSLSTMWVEYAKANWHYLPNGAGGGQVVKIALAKLPIEGIPFRLRGGGPPSLVSAETDLMPIEPRYITEYAQAYLQKSRSGIQSVDNPAVQAREWMSLLGVQGSPTRHLPANAVRIWPT